MRSEPVLVTGATGYVGGRLIPQLLDSGYRVRVVGRSLPKLQSRPWATEPNVELAEADALDYDSVERAARGCWAAFYLIHSMGADKDFKSLDRLSAENFRDACIKAGVKKIIYPRMNSI